VPSGAVEVPPELLSSRAAPTAVDAFLRAHLACRDGLPLLRFPPAPAPALSDTWRDALTAAAADGTLAYPLALRSSNWASTRCTALEALRQVKVDDSVYGVESWVPRGAPSTAAGQQRAAVRGPTTTAAWPTRGTYTAWPAFPHGGGTALCIRREHHQMGRLVSSAYAETARLTAKRLGCPSMLEAWCARAGAAAAAAVAKYGGVLSRMNLADAVHDTMGAHEVTCFPPWLAAVVYKYFGATSVLDPCGGWGDRLFAALALGLRYVCTDPTPAVHAAYDAMLADVAAAGVDTTRVTHVVAPFEDVPLDDPRLAGLFDLVMTSPPYFRLEVYSTDANQSVTRAENANSAASPRYDGPMQFVSTDDVEELPVLAAWCRDFLFPLAANALARLRSGGHLVLAVNDYKGVHYVHALVAHVATLRGVEFRGVIGHEISDIVTANGVLAPLFVWRKT